MAIIASDIVKYLSGGAANTTANLSLGGAGNAADTITTAVSNNLFYETSDAESTSGATDSSGPYTNNTHRVVVVAKPTP